MFLESASTLEIEESSKICFLKNKMVVINKLVSGLIFAAVFHNCTNL